MDFVHPTVNEDLNSLDKDPLLQEPFQLEHLKSRLLGHWGSDSGQVCTYLHFNRLIKKYDLDAFFHFRSRSRSTRRALSCLPRGHILRSLPKHLRRCRGHATLLQAVLLPWRNGSDATPETPGSLHEGGELGYSLSHAFGTVYDHPNLIALTMIDDGESETGPLATSWHGNKFLNPKVDGSVLPALHSNGYKINNPTVLARIKSKKSSKL